MDPFQACDPAAEYNEFHMMIKSFKVTDLQILLRFAERNPNGRKNELQCRALNLIHLPGFLDKTRELYYKYKSPRIHDSQNLCSVRPMSEHVANPNPYETLSYHDTSIAMSTDLLGKNIKNMQPVNVTPRYAVHPDVKFINLPFYDLLGELMRPTSLLPMGRENVCQRTFSFYLTPQQVSNLQQDRDLQVQLRFCYLEQSCEQEDMLPHHVSVLINNRVAYAYTNFTNAALELKKRKRPLDITQVTKLTATEANVLNISFDSSDGRPYTVAVFLVRKLSANTLINRLKLNGVRNPDHTTAIIKEKLSQDRDSEIATMSLKGSLICPLGKSKMQFPCRALTCAHLQCFDATLYIHMNEKKPKWICPVCDKSALFSNLAIDGLFLDIVSKAPSECTEVQFHKDGSWNPIMPVKKNSKMDSGVSQNFKDALPKNKRPNAIEVVDVLDSGSDNEDVWAAPAKKKPCYKPFSFNSPENNKQLASGTAPRAFDPRASASESHFSLFANLKEINIDSSAEENSVSISKFTPDTKVPIPENSASNFNQPSASSTSQSSLDNAENFDYYSLLQNTPDINYLPISQQNSPDVISIDD